MSTKNKDTEIETEAVNEATDGNTAVDTAAELNELKADNALLKALVMQAIEKKDAPAPSAKKQLTVDNTQAQKAFSEMVPIRLYKDNGAYKDDLFVRVNGRYFKIQRGKTVYVPRPVKEVIDQSEETDRHCANLIQELVDNYQE